MNSQIYSQIYVRESEPLSRHCTFAIGGNALLFACPKDVDELQSVLSFAQQEDLPFYILGNGSNVLFADRGFPGVVISMKDFNSDLLSVENNKLTCSSGLLVSKLVHWAMHEGLSNVEFLCGVPGTVGGAIWQNCSYSGRAISDVLESITVLDPYRNDIESLPAQDLIFEYRSTKNIQGIILDATFSVAAQEKNSIKQKIAEYVTYRQTHQDLSLPSAGCVFKNPQGSELSAGQMIDRCGLKGVSVGGAQISAIHANYLVNTGGATASDVMVLIERIKEAVMVQFNIPLELELEYVV